MAAEDGLKAQKLLAQGSALGNVGKKQRRPVRAKALYTARYFKAFALTGRQVCVCNNPGRCPGRALKKSPFLRTKTENAYDL